MICWQLILFLILTILKTYESQKKKKDSTRNLDRNNRFSGYFNGRFFVCAFYQNVLKDYKVKNTDK